MHEAQNAGTDRRLAVIVRELLVHESFESLADLVDAVKVACVRYELPWTNEAIAQALWLATNRLPPSPAPHQSPIVLRRDEMVPLSPLERAARARKLRAICDATIKPMEATMRYWVRARRFGLCGRCGAQYRPDDPLYVIAFSKLVKVRCRQCADGPVPADIPEWLPPALQHLVNRAALEPPASDWKSRAAGERDPGEEG